MKAQPLVVYLPDASGVSISRFGIGNRKIGMGVFTYSRLPGRPDLPALGAGSLYDEPGTCPGSTVECRAICYAARPVAEAGPVRDLWEGNAGNDVPEIPAECKVLRIHVSGDFDTPEYILNWVERLRQRADVTAWAYTRSWRCHSLLEYLEVLRGLPNVQLFASMDPSTMELPPAGWRRAWIWRDSPRPRFDDGDLGAWPMERRLYPIISSQDPQQMQHNLLAEIHGTRPTPAYVCPEETGRRRDCLECGYCFEGQKHDVVFLEH